jgi:hypothetical protein
VTLAPEELAAYAGTYVGESGEHLEIGVGWDALELVAAEPGAQELLFGPPPPAGSHGRKLMERSLAVLEAAAAGRFEPLAEALDADPEEVGRREGAAWARLRNDWGEYRWAMPIGVGAGPEMVVHVSLVFERGGRIARLTWEDEQLIEIAVGGRQPGRSVRPASPSEFLEHDFESGRSWRMRFELDERGAPRAALLPGAAGEVRLRIL